MNTYSSVHKDAFSFTGNQAALAGSKHISVGAYGEKRFMLDDLSSSQLAFVLPVSGGGFALQAKHFGSSTYNESKLGLAYGRNLGKIDVGVQFNYCGLKAGEYGRASAINFEAGAILHVSDQFQTGFHIYNPTRVALGKNSEERLPVIYSFGMGYDVSDKFFIGTQIEKTEDQPADVNAGLYYAFEKKLFARAGISSATSSFYFGLGFSINNFRIDATASWHQVLGVSPGIALLYNTPDKK